MHFWFHIRSHSPNNRSFMVDSMLNMFTMTMPLNAFYWVVDLWIDWNWISVPTIIATLDRKLLKIPSISFGYIRYIPFTVFSLMSRIKTFPGSMNGMSPSSVFHWRIPKTLCAYMTLPFLLLQLSPILWGFFKSHMEWPQGKETHRICRKSIKSFYWLCAVVMYGYLVASVWAQNRVWYT